MIWARHNSRAIYHAIDPIWARHNSPMLYHAVVPEDDKRTVCGLSTRFLRCKLVEERRLPFGISAVPLTEHRCPKCDKLLRARSRNPTNLTRNPAKKGRK